jgi:hypothetical protein
MSSRLTMALCRFAMIGTANFPTLRPARTPWQMHRNVFKSATV